MTRFADDTRPRMFGEEALWLYKRGAARAGARTDGRRRGRSATARSALEGRNWVHGRAHLELGKLALKAGSTEAARAEFGTAATLADSDNDPMTAADARRLMK